MFLTRLDGCKQSTIQQLLSVEELTNWHAVVTATESNRTVPVGAVPPYHVQLIDAMRLEEVDDNLNVESASGRC
jgi:hypothetical protein